MKYLNRYNNAVARYRAGEFGNKNLSLHDILNAAGEPNLMDKLSVSEVRCLLFTATGITKNLFSTILKKEENRIACMERLEEELQQYKIDSYRSADNDSDEKLAEKLNLIVEYCDEGALPKDTEALLCPTEAANSFGVIKILKDRATTKFSFRHELIHYFRDVKVGNRVTAEFARNSKGNTPNNEEQEVNYLTAASIMPFEEIRNRLSAFEEASSKEDEHRFLTNLAIKFDQNEDAVLRRFVEVRNMVDYSASRI